MKRFYLKILLPTILTILLFTLTIFFLIIPRFQQNVMNGKREMIQELTNSAWSILSEFETEERQGLLTREEAQKNAISRIQFLRYGDENKDYFWITDTFPNMIMHPFRPDLNGKDLTDFTDPHGKKLFVECVETVKKSEHGYVNYMWQWKDDSTHIVPKLSYVKLFKPWNWVIGTGIYIEDAKKEISALSRKLLWISIGISILTALLLFYIIKQSLNIERNRIEAENELTESKEKYRALVEAATEGLLMLIDGKISFANTILSKILGYDSSDLINCSLVEIISENNNKSIIEIFLKNPIIKDGQFELNLKKKSGGFVEVLITSSTAKFFGNTVNILIIKDISVDRNITFTNLDYQKLINTLNLGFFKIRIDTKGKVLYANETAIRMFGFESFDELSNANIIKLLSDSEEWKNLRKTLMSEGYIKNKILAINPRNNTNLIVALSFVVTDNEDPEHLICDGIIEDITVQENEKIQYNNLITSLKSSGFLLEQPIKDYLTPFHSINADSTISDAMRIFSKQKTECLLVTKNENEHIGIISKTDIQERVLTLNLNLDNPVYLIMSSPIFYISSDTSVADAIYTCEDKNINQLVARNETNAIKGIFSAKSMYKLIKNSQALFIDKARKAETTDELKQYYKAHQQFIKPIINSDIFIKHVTNLASSFSDTINKKLIEFAISKLGVPPVDFSFICLGSEGRQEESLFTDQDNAIIYEDVPTEEEAMVSEYFNQMGIMVCNALNEIGYSYCKGNIMAKNPQWNQSISSWEKYFANWIITPEPQNLLEAIIFFDFRNIYGNEAFTERLRKRIDTLIAQQSVFLYHLASNIVHTKTQNISSGNLLMESNAEMLDLKGCINHIIMFARTYSLQNNIWSTNTIERLEALKSKHVIEKKTIDELIFGYNFLMKLRFKNQVHQLNNNLPISNMLNTKGLIDIEATILKKVLSQLNANQHKLSIDFRINN